MTLRAQRVFCRGTDEMGGGGGGGEERESDRQTERQIDIDTENAEYGNFIQ